MPIYVVRVNNYSQPLQIVASAGSIGADIVPFFFAWSSATSCAAFMAASMALNFSSKVMSSVIIWLAFISLESLSHLWH